MAFKRFRVLVASFGLLVATCSLGVTTYPAASSLPYARSAAELQGSLEVPVEQRRRVLPLPAELMTKRAKLGKPGSKVEPLYLYVPMNDEHLWLQAQQISRPGRVSVVAKALLRKRQRMGNKGHSRVKVQLNMRDLRDLDHEKLGGLLGKQHLNVSFPSEALRSREGVYGDLVRQIRPYIGSNQLRKFKKKVKRGYTIDLDTDLLPRFARKSVGKYRLFQGPNCFHAALSFHSKTLSESSSYNVKEEAGYHPSMVNYDELWRILRSSFYEVNHQRYPLKYGDVLVFYDLPNSSIETMQPDFRWMRHASVYLFNRLTYSKGSKSAATPYSVKTIEEEWQHWGRYSTNLGIKVFRRNSLVVSKKPPFDLADWIY